MNARLSAIAALQTRLGVTFRDPSLLEQALTHASVGDGARKTVDNERLEFLGDRVLGLMIAEALMDTFPEAEEGEMSKRFHALVSRDTCAAIARKIELGAAMRLAAGETKSGGRSNPTILGDALEALIAAIYRDQGYDAVKAVFLPLWRQAIDDSADVRRSNPKSFLQEWAAARGKPVPVYNLVSRKGPDHAPVFTIAAEVEGLAPQAATGKSRQEAEKAAALSLIEREKLN